MIPRTLQKVPGWPTHGWSSFQLRMADAIFEFGQICNTQNSAMALYPDVGNYQSRDPTESQVFQNHSASMSALWTSKIITLVCSIFLVVAS